jgi:hypothetical protein
LNLPPEIRLHLENVFIVGLIPPPNLPDAFSICHILSPMCNTFCDFWNPGKQIPTHHHPDGILVRTRIHPALADLEAIRKFSGFLSHSATQLCSYCDVTSDNIESLILSDWNIRDNAEVRQYAQDWLNATSQKAKKDIASSTGV